MSRMSVFLIIMVFLSSPVRAALCDDPLRDQQTCYRMKVLRGHLDLLDAQRDLMRVNYPYLGAIAAEMRAMAQAVQASRPGSHLSPMKGVESLAAQLAAEAISRDSKALATANQIRTQCLNCHSGPQPSSGVAWEKISAIDWEKVIPKCNAGAGNPYLCKSMHGFRSIYSYYLAGAATDGQSFPVVEQTAMELKRIAADLKGKGFVHGKAGQLEALGQDAEELRLLARAKDPRAFQRGAELSTSCLKCHGESRGGRLSLKFTQ